MDNKNNGNDLKKNNKKSRLLMLGWIALGVNIFSWWGAIVGDMAFPILNWQAHLLRSSGMILGETIGSNIFTILAFVAGLRVWKHSKNKKGRILVYSSICVFVLSLLAYLFFSF